MHRIFDPFCPHFPPSQRCFSFVLSLPPRVLSARTALPSRPLTSLSFYCFHSWDRGLPSVSHEHGFPDSRVLPLPCPSLQERWQQFSLAPPTIGSTGVFPRLLMVLSSDPGSKFMSQSILSFTCRVAFFELSYIRFTLFPPGLRPPCHNVLCSSPLALICPPPGDSHPEFY